MSDEVLGGGRSNAKEMMAMSDIDESGVSGHCCRLWVRCVHHRRGCRAAVRLIVICVLLTGAALWVFGAVG
jgi:hypothetical protein